ncbi:MAG: preprotein translocase subunit SecA [Limisphaerales bacterium]|jgi:preprotein translocase subunit SecA
MSFFTKALTKLFGGNKYEKDVKEASPLVDRTNEEFAKLSSISHDALRNKTVEFRARIADFLSSIDNDIHRLQREVKEQPDMHPDMKEARYLEIDKLKETRDIKGEEILLELLPEAFAVVKETAKRFSTNSEIEVTPTDLDRQLAPSKDFVEIRGEQAIWFNEWAAGGNIIKWDMVHYDVQLIGGIKLHSGKISEMATGEGKTLVATLPAYLNGLMGLGVHVVTVNNYLAKRDSEWIGPILSFLGLTVDCIDNYPPHSPDRRLAYNCDITYGTNNEFGFDYLRDNMVRHADEMVQGKHHFGMIDEVDSVLIDDARTPLIISGPVPKTKDQEFNVYKPRIQRLHETQRKTVQKLLQDAKRLIESGNTDEGGVALLRAHRGLPKYSALIKFLSETGNKQVLQKTENFYMQDNSRRMPEIDDELYFIIDEKINSVELVEKGIDLLTVAGEDENFFVMPDVGALMHDIDTQDLEEEEKLSQKDTLMQDFSIKSERLHAVQQLLKAYTLFEKDVEYVVMEDQVKIVDEQTGRIMDGRRYSDGLHQAIEAKENVKVQDATQTFATVTLQNFFRMYHKLSGMTGTAETEANEFWEIYKLDVTVIPTNRPIVRDDRDDLVFRTKREKYNAVIDEVVRLTDNGQPVLVGTTSVEVSELLSRMLRLKGIEHNVLNAKQHSREADIVQAAGRPSAVTIATNMAGRGTDIKLGEGVVEAGGLAIVGTERHESRRIDRQLRGRAGRQGDPGASQFYVSLEDDLMRLFTSDKIAGLMDKMGFKEGEVIQHSMVSKSIERAQRKVEENNFGVRKHLLEYDDVMNSQREHIYQMRRNAVHGRRLEVDLNNMFVDLAEEVVTENKESGDYESFRMDAIRYFSIDPEIEESEFNSGKTQQLADKLYSTSRQAYERKTSNLVSVVWPLIKDLYESKAEQMKNVRVPFTDGRKQLDVSVDLKEAYDTEGRAIITAFEKGITLAVIDDSWKEHLRQMDDLRQLVRNAQYEQKDPLLIYKFEAFELFKKMMSNINKEVSSFIYKGSIPLRQSSEVKEAAPRSKTDMSGVNASHAAARPVLAGAVANRGDFDDGSAAKAAGAAAGGEEGSRVKQVVRSTRKVGRNEQCPCGSGKKYKHCHGSGE